MSQTTDAGARSITFAGKSFCFTGSMASLKRAVAEREARARGGLTFDDVHQRLDFLVVGTIPSKGWAHGSYGRKIEKALELRAQRSGIRIVQETEFMQALAEVPTENAGDLDHKVVVATIKWYAESLESFDHPAVEGAFEMLAAEGWHVSACATPLAMVSDLYEGLEQDDGVMVEARCVRQAPLDADEEAMRRALEDTFLPIRGVDPRVRMFARKEGSAGYARLLTEVPQRLRLE